MKNDSIGVDISKTHLDAHRLSTGQHARFDNTPDGLRALRKWLKGTPLARVVYEPTGAYHRLLETRLGEHLPLTKVNPLQARRFAQAHGTRAKTDAVDARMLAIMGHALELVPDQPMDEIQRTLKELRSARTGLSRDRTAQMNRLETAHLPLLKSQIKARITQIERHIAAIDAETERLIKSCPKRRRMLEILTSIPGIGDITARAICAGCPEIGTLHHKQIAALAGLAPMTRQSGSWHGKARIQGGRKDLRHALFMPALVAMKRNPDLSAKYTALRKAGKPHKVALTTLMRKLIQLANTLVKEDRTWSPKKP